MKTKDFTIQEDNGKEVMLSVKVPQHEDFEESDKVYGSKIASLVRESSGSKRQLLMRKEVDQFLRSKGIWTDQDEKTIEKLQLEIDQLLNRMRKGGIKLSEGRDLAIQTMDKRKEIVRIMSKRQIFDDSTIEALAENEKVDYLIYACTVYAQDGKNYWMSFEDMKNDKVSDAYQKASNLAYEVIYNVNPEFEKRLPENKWLQKYGFIDDSLNYIDRKTGERVDRDGRPVKELEEQAIRQIQNLQGDIVEEQPYIDDDTNTPVVVDSKKEETDEKQETKEKSDNSDTSTESTAEVK